MADTREFPTAAELLDMDHAEAVALFKASAVTDWDLLDADSRAIILRLNAEADAGPDAG